MSRVKELYQLVSDIYSEDEFEETLEEKRDEFDGYFDDEALAHIIVAEEGRNEEAIDDIKDVEVGEECTVEGEIIDLGTLRTFENEDGEGKVRNVRIDDGTGTIKVVFWNEETEMVKEEFELGTKIRVINGYVQDKGYGKQLTTGRGGEIEVMEEDRRKKD
ncbi:MAG: hypothetical protein KGY76_01060 [Candidatus Thermoplasmatota archaeon]|nr:hypothetical protein [Candidatus Thermoplasmatota archaeon]